MNCCFCFRQKPSNDESNMSKGKALVQELIKTKKVLMISKEYCPFCVKAKDALKNYKVFLHGGRVQWTKSYLKTCDRGSTRSASARRLEGDRFESRPDTAS